MPRLPKVGPTNDCRQLNQQAPASVWVREMSDINEKVLKFVLRHSFNEMIAGGVNLPKRKLEALKTRKGKNRK